MLRLLHPTDAWRSARYTADEKDCPRVHLVRWHGALLWRIGKRYLPFANCVEFALDTGWHLT